MPLIFRTFVYRYVAPLAIVFWAGVYLGKYVEAKNTISCEMRDYLLQELEKAPKASSCNGEECGDL